MTEYEKALQERFEEFLRTYKNEHGNLVYWRQIQQMSINDETSLSIDFEDLSTFDNVFMVEAAEDPTSFLETADNALRSLLRVEDPDYVRRLPRGTIRARIVNYPEYIALRALRSKYIGRMIQIAGYVREASETTSLLFEGLFKCRICEEEISQRQEDGRYTEPPICPICGKKTKMRLIEEKSRFCDFQTFSLVEKWSNTNEQSKRASVNVESRFDLAGKVENDQEIKVVGIVAAKRVGRPQATFEPIIQANSIRIVKQAPEPRKQKESAPISSEEELENLLQQRPSFLGHHVTFIDRQVDTESGRLDLIMRTPDGAYLVVELKNEKADHDVVSQLQMYLSWVKSKYAPDAKVRGAIVARGFSDRLLDAAKGSRFHIRLVDVSDILNK